MSDVQTGKKRIDPLSLVAILIVLGIIGLNVWNAKEAKTPTVSETPSEPVASETLPEKDIQSDFAFPNDVASIPQAEMIINQSQGKTGAAGNLEQIVYGIVKDPETPTTLYFATSANHPTENFVGVYRYDTLTRRWTRLFKETYRSGDGQEVKRLHVVGTTGTELILTQDRLGDLLPPCTSPLLTSQTLYSLSLIQAQDGLKPFQLTEEARGIEEERQSSCKNS